MGESLSKFEQTKREGQTLRQTFTELFLFTFTPYHPQTLTDGDIFPSSRISAPTRRFPSPLFPSILYFSQYCIDPPIKAEPTVRRGLGYEHALMNRLISRWPKPCVSLSLSFPSIHHLLTAAYLNLIPRQPPLIGLAVGLHLHLKGVAREVGGVLKGDNAAATRGIYVFTWIDEVCINPGFARVYVRVNVSHYPGRWIIIHVMDADNCFWAHKYVSDVEVK